MKIIIPILTLVAIFAIFNNILSDGEQKLKVRPIEPVSRYICQNTNPLQHVLANIWSMSKDSLFCKYRDEKTESFGVKFNDLIVHVTMRSEEYKGVDDDMFVFDLRCLSKDQKPYDADYFTLNRHGMLVEYGNNSKGKVFDRSAPYDHVSFEKANIVARDLKTLHDEHKQSSFYAHILLANLLHFYFETNLKPTNKGSEMLNFYNRANELIFTVHFDTKYGVIYILPSIGEYNDMPIRESGFSLK